ncbi:MAG: hypothetical protein KF866_11090 [Phycisphaeraceae bacterium]|nr:hypothetical protein [Phycisphaeraceae bacterium]MCW5754279.1 hypothetical protein [Phycisphaeraceae bacterium]
MSGMMAWVKGHIAPVVCLGLIVISLPTAWYFSSRWSKSIVQREQKRLEGSASELTRVERMNYTLPRIAPDEQPVELRYAPNVAVARHFKSLIEARHDQVDRVTDEALRFNRRQPIARYAEYIAELTTNPRSPRLRTLPFDVLRDMRGERDAGAYARLLRDQRSGVDRVGLPLPERRVREVLDRRTQDFSAERVRQRGPQDGLSPDEQAQLRDELQRLRLDVYRRRASEVSVFADPEIFYRAGRIPAAAPAQPPSDVDLFEMQWNYWITSDVLAAIEIANTSGDRRVGADAGVVKRVLAYVIDDIAELWTGSSVADFGYGDEGGGMTSSRQAVPEENGIIGTSRSWSVTGRLTNPGNPLYDVREVRLSLVVDAERLPELLAALPRANFMTVLEMNLHEVDVWNDLRQGYFYGSAPVVRVELVLETIWIREWLAPLMPPNVRQRLGVTDVPVSQG